MEKIKEFNTEIMKKYSLVIVLVGISFHLFSQNAPFYIWGTGLNGDTFQKTAIYTDVNNGLIIEGPLNTQGDKLPIGFNWRGGGIFPMYILPNGNVGFGTKIPKSNIEIQSGGSETMLKIRHRNELNPDWGVSIGQNEDLSGFLGCSGKNLEILSGWDKQLILGTKKYDEYNGSVVFPGGKIGIGTTTPEYKLDVVGTIRTRELKVDMQGADFVFEEDYELRSIEEVEEYVSVNKHLPEIAPAKEMQENGVNQSEMNQKLLQKIEELTLYVIRQNKEQKSQNKEIAILKEEIKQLRSAK